jgi:hypothetical protein
MHVFLNAHGRTSFAVPQCCTIPARYPKKQRISLFYLIYGELILNWQNRDFLGSARTPCTQRLMARSSDHLQSTPPVSPQARGRARPRTLRGAAPTQSSRGAPFRSPRAITKFARDATIRPHFYPTYHAVPSVSSQAAHSRAREPQASFKAFCNLKPTRHPRAPPPSHTAVSRWWSHTTDGGLGGVAVRKNCGEKAPGARARAPPQLRCSRFRQ